MSSFTRAELYELVWSRPLKLIAEAHGLDAIRLARACDEYEIARPLAGHWQKLEHGKTVVKPPLTNGKFEPDDVPDLKARRRVKTKR